MVQSPVSQSSSPGYAKLRFALAIAAVLLSPLAFRLILLLERAPTGPGIPDLRGILSDTFVSLLCLSILVLVNRFSRAVAGTLTAFWAAFQYVNFENVRVLDSLVTVQDASYLSDTTFIFGSALVVSSPLLLASLVLASGAFAALGLRLAALRHAGAALAAALICGLAYALWPWSDDVALWRQTNFIHHNAGRLVRAAVSGEPEGRRFPNAATAMLDLMPALRADFSGEPIVPLERRGTNVLLVILESISGLRIPVIAEAHGHAAESPMLNLGALARENMSWSTFVSHQRKTARGLYAILCGELPALLRSGTKMSQFVASDRTCLPAALRAAGYTTAYLQGAPLAFHMKDQFMPRAGFERVHGHDWFEREHLRTYWGVDDRTLFEQTLPLIEDLESGEKPWFLTLLTVGTHHPFSVPDDWDGGQPDSYARALAYLDFSFGEFYRQLQERGILDDTILLVTSDEAKGFPLGEHSLARITQNWGLLIARLPERHRALITEPFAQIDLAVSVLDMLGLSERGRHFFGRSVFRRYEDPRWIFFANGNKHDVGALDPEGRVLICLDDFRKCKKRGSANGTMFGANAIQLEWDEERDGIVREMATRSLYARADETLGRVFQLIGKPSVLVDKERLVVLYGGQHLMLAANEWIEVEVEMEVRGGPGKIEFLHTLRAGGGRTEILNKTLELETGDKLNIHYRYAPREVRHEVQARGYSRLLAGGPVTLAFGTAKITRYGSAAPMEGLEILTHEVIQRAAR